MSDLRKIDLLMEGTKWGVTKKLPSKEETIRELPLRLGEKTLELTGVEDAVLTLVDTKQTLLSRGGPNTTSRTINTTLGRPPMLEAEEALMRKYTFTSLGVLLNGYVYDPHESYVLVERQELLANFQAFVVLLTDIKALQ